MHAEGVEGVEGVEKPVGELLRQWRKRRRMSQLELAITADVSARHISFVETGRTSPSRSMVLRLAERLGVPLRDRNDLLIAAGYAPVYRERRLDSPDMSVTTDALKRVLRGYEPYPALMVDRRWNLLFANAAAELFFDEIDPALLKAPVNLMRLALHPDGLAPRLLNLPEVRTSLLGRLARQAHRTGDAELIRLHEELVGYGLSDGHRLPEPSEIALPIRVVHRGRELCLVNTITTFGTAFDITLDDIAIEAFLPADEATAAALHKTTDLYGGDRP